MRKPIKFDLLVGDEFIHDLDELRARFSSEIIPLFRQGLLTRWFYHRDRAIYDALLQLPEDISDREAFWTIAKLIKAQPAELTIGGESVQTLEELTDNFSVDILELFRSGKLAAFLDRIGEGSLFQQVAQMNVEQLDVAAFQQLCELFGVEFDLDTALLMLQRAGYDTTTPTEGEEDEEEVIAEEAAIPAPLITSLTEDAARQLVKSCKTRELTVESETLSENVANILVRHQGPVDPVFSAINLSSGNVMDSIYPNQLTFVNLSYLLPEIARILARFSGVLDFQTLPSLSFESARLIVNRIDGIRFGGLKSLPFDVLSALMDEQLFGIFPVFLDFPGLTDLDAASARLFEDFQGELHLGLPAISIETAQILARRRAKTYFTGLTEISIELEELICEPSNSLCYPRFADSEELTEMQAEHLLSLMPATGWPCYPGTLTLRTKVLSVPVATLLVEYGGRLIFTQLDTMTPDIARILARHQLQLRNNIYQIPMGAWLSFPALTSISRECMHYFVRGQTNAQLAFDGLTNLDLGVAKELADLKRSTLLLNGVQTLEDAAAGELSKMQEVTLQLNKLARLPFSLAKSFCNNDGFLCLMLGGVKTIDAEVEKLLTFYFSGQIYLKGRVFYPYKDIQRVKNCLFPDFLGLTDTLSIHQSLYE